jgi:4-hydroxyphenylpyruvate dioxygenase
MPDRFILQENQVFIDSSILSQAASYYCTRWGFDIIGYKGLETGSREIVSYALRLDKV